MAFNKVFMVAVLLAIVAVTADARVELSRLSDYPWWCPVESCTYCQCEKDSTGNIICRQTDILSGQCPASCKGMCACDRSVCFKCRCTYEVKNCGTELPTSTATEFENNLALNRN